MWTFLAAFAGWASIILILRHNTKQLQRMASDQEHLDQDVAAMGSAFTTVINELKAQAAAAQPPVPLDFTKADAFLATIQAEATADAPPAPTPAPAVS